jgi:hypothetical protein
MSEYKIKLRREIMNKKIILVLLSVFIVAVVAGSAIAAEAKVNTEIKMLSEKTLKNGDDIEFQLKDAQGKEIASQKVNISFEVNGKYENYSVITDEHGKGYLVLFNEALGDHKVIINYTGNEKYNPYKLEETIKIVEGTSKNDKTNANSTASTIKYDNATKNATNATNDTGEILYYDAEYNFYYNQFGVIKGGQNDGMDAYEIASHYAEQEAKGNTNLE